MLGLAGRGPMPMTALRLGRPPPRELARGQSLASAALVTPRGGCVQAGVPPAMGDRRRGGRCIDATRMPAPRVAGALAPDAAAAGPAHRVAAPHRGPAT